MREIADLAMRVAELERRASHAMRHGTVHEVDAAKGTTRLKIGGTDQEPLPGPWIPYAQTAGALKAHVPPSVGQQFTMLSPSGDYRQAVALPLTWSEQNESPSQSGTENVMTYGGWRLKLDGNDLHITKGGLSFLLQADKVTVKVSDIAIEADVKIKGDVQIEGDFLAEGQAFHHNGVFVGDDHVHTKVVPGNSLSGPPPGG